MKNIRIAFMGASGTGKTTLAKWVSDKYGLQLNPIGSRTVAADMGLASPYDADAAGRRSEMQERLLQSKAAWEAERDAFVTDRTVFDNLAYQSLHAVDSVTEMQLSKAVHAMRRYTHIIWCPMRAVFSLRDDPARKEGRAYHLMFESVLLGFFAAYEFEFDTMTATEPEERRMLVRIFTALPPPECKCGRLVKDHVTPCSSEGEK